MPLILPQLDDLNRPFWDGCREGVLRLQHCRSCHSLRYPIASVCPSCLSTDYSWEEMSGHGEIYTFGVFRHVYNDAWSGRAPYAVSIVKLDEGPFMIADLVDLDVNRVHVGMQVKVHFDSVTPDVTIPRFGPA